MRVVLKHLKRLPNGKFQFRRVWPVDVRQALPELGRESKKNFHASDERAAIRVCLDLNRSFEMVVQEVRTPNSQLQPDWAVAEKVAKWYARMKPKLDAVVSKQPVIAANHGIVISEETGADFERDRILEEAATREGVDQFGHPKQLTLEENLRLTALSSGKPPKVPLKISDAYQIYRSKHLNGRPDKASEAAVAQLIEFAGDIPLEMITRTKAAEWLDHLMTDRGQSNETLRRRIGAMKAIVNFVINRDLHEDVNPFAKLKPPKAAKRPGERLPFHTVHLEAIDRYLASSNVRPETRQIVALLKLTGCRPSEIAGLKAEDLSLESGLPFLFVRWTEERRLKNEESTRRVPLIGEALDAAKAAREAVGTGWLFPSLAPKTGDANDNQAMSTRLRYMIRRAGVPASSRLVPYSFRHTVATALDQTEGVSQTVRDRVLGHGRLDKYSARCPPSAPMAQVWGCDLRRIWVSSQ